MIARRVIVRGKVQGVFYRDWTVRAARQLGLAGWVRNCSDGTVEAQVQGAEEAVRQMIGLMGRGPPRAAVERIDEELSEPEPLAGFERR